MVAVTPGGKVPTEKTSPAFMLVRVMVALTMLVLSTSVTETSVSPTATGVPVTVLKKVL